MRYVLSINSKAVASIVLLGNSLALLTLALGSTLCAQTISPAPSDTELMQGPYPDAPAIAVMPRQQELAFFPCQQCHATLQANPEVRDVRIHRTEFNHGEGRIWCLQCHDSQQRNYLTTLLGQRVSFEQAHLVCGGCHGRVERDWYFGAHGKRVGNWQGERVVYGCSHCHDPHDPAIKPRAPSPPPAVRKGLDRPGSPNEATGAAAIEPQGNIQ